MQLCTVWQSYINNEHWIRDGSSQNSTWQEIMEMSQVGSKEHFHQLDLIDSKEKSTWAMYFNNPHDSNDSQLKPDLTHP